MPRGSKVIVRLVVPAPEGAADRRGRVLARPNGLAGWQLPTIAVSAAPSWGPDHDAAAAALLGGQVHPVRRLDDDAWEVEIAGRLPAGGTTWIGADDADRAGRDAGLIRTWSATPYDDVAHLRPGWRRAVDAWAAEHLGATGPVRLVRHWELAALVAVPTGTGDVVVKEPGPGFEREVAITAALDGLSGAPRVVATGSGRLVTAWAGGRHPDDRVAVAGRVGRLQREAADGLRSLIDAGCHPVARDLPDTRDERLTRSLEQVADLSLTDSVVHGDAHPGNAVVDDAGDITIIDWSDASIGCPAIDLDLLTGMGQARFDPRPMVEAWADGFDCDPAPVLDALPHLRRVARHRTIGILRRVADVQPPSARSFWEQEQTWFAEALAALDCRDG